MAGKNRKSKKNEKRESYAENLPAEKSRSVTYKKQPGIIEDKIISDTVEVGEKASFFARFKKSGRNRRQHAGAGSVHEKGAAQGESNKALSDSSHKITQLRKKHKLFARKTHNDIPGSTASGGSSRHGQTSGDNGNAEDRHAQGNRNGKSLSDFLHKDHALLEQKADSRTRKEAEKKQRNEEKRKLEQEAKSIGAFLNKQNGKDDRSKDNSIGGSGKRLPEKEKKVRRNRQPDNKASGMSVFKNDIKLVINGYNQTRLINALTKGGIKIKLLQRQSQKQLTIVVPKKSAEKTFAILDKLCYNYEAVHETGAKPAARWIAKRAGLIAGAVIFTALAFFSGTFIWKIEISGNDRVDELQIIRELKGINIAVGRNKKFDEFAVRQKINSIDNILECTVEVVGTTVKIKVVETTEYNPPEPGGEPRDIISKYDAEITRVIVKDGTGKVGIGDRIAAGSVLISREVLNTNGEVMGETRASGEVYGKVVFSKSAVVSTSQEVTVRTGRSYRMTELRLWGIKIGAKNKNKFLSYETVFTESYPFKNTFLPIRINQTTFYETETKFEETGIDELQDKFKREALLELVINAGGSEINTIVTREEIAAGLYRVHVYIEAEMKLS